MPHIDELQGLWRRSLIDWPDGRRDTTTDVAWLQGPSLYIDLRQPAGRPDFARARCLRALDAEQVAWLATQEGFAGTLTHDGTWFEWRRAIDVQPKALYSDVGRLWFADGHMVEEGRDVAYIEHWHRDAAPHAPCVGLVLAEEATGRAGHLVRVGNLFMLARDRAVRPAEGLHLTECVAAAQSLADAQDLVDCEISLGTVIDGAWIVTRSSLPYRERTLLDPRRAGATLAHDDQSADGVPIARRWRIVSAEGDVAAVPAVEERAA